jgi:hypothetical protein
MNFESGLQLLTRNKGNKMSATALRKQKQSKGITITDNADGSVTVLISGRTQTYLERAASKDGTTPEGYLRGLIAADKPRRDAFVAAAHQAGVGFVLPRKRDS